ncbi:MAG: hypothetical protein ChlgKO_14340 [Chlamydiales bacterium]
MRINSEQKIDRGLCELLNTVNRTAVAFSMINSGNKNEIKDDFLLLLRGGIDVNHFDGCFLKFWCDQEDLTVVEALVERGVNIIKTEEKYGSLLSGLIMRKNFDLTNYLLTLSDINFSTETLIQSIKHGTPEILSRVVDEAKNRGMHLLQHFESKSPLDYLSERLRSEECETTKLGLLPFENTFSTVKMFSELDGFLESTELSEYGWGPYS